MAEIKGGAFVTRKSCFEAFDPDLAGIAKMEKELHLANRRASRERCPILAFFISDEHGAVYVLAGVGLVVLTGLPEFNSAQGALGALSAMLAWQIADSGGPQWVGWIAAVTASTALALFYGRLIAPRLASSDPIVRAVATLGFALIILGFCEFVWGEWPRSLRLPSDTLGFEILGVRVAATRAIAFGLGLAVTIGMILFSSSAASVCRCVRLQTTAKSVG